MIEITEFPQSSGIDHIELTANVVSAYVSGNHVRATDLPALIAGIHATIANLSRASVSSTPAAEKPTPGQIRKSISPDALISFEDGKPYKTLRRHLTLRGLTPEAYRSKHGLPVDYPMTAASYSAQRSELARSLGLGRQRSGAAVATSPEPSTAEVAPEIPKKAGRPRKVKEPAKA